MSTKPSFIPLWCSGGTKTQPSLQKLTAGYSAGEQVGPYQLNFIMNAFGLWCQYLNDGALVGNTSITGTLGVTSDVTINGNLEVDGTFRELGTHTKVLSTAFSFESLNVNPSSWAHTRELGQWLLSTSGNAIYYPIDLPSDCEVTSYSVTMTKNTSASVISTRLCSMANNTITTESAGAASPTTAASYAIGESGLAVSAASKQLLVRVIGTGGATPSGDLILGASINYRRI